MNYKKLMNQNSNRSNNFPSYPRVDWERVCEVEKDSIVVTVACQPLRIPRYSIEIGIRVSQDRAGRHFHTRVIHQEDGQVIIQRINKQALVEALTIAENKILEMAKQDKEDSDSES